MALLACVQLGQPRRMVGDQWKTCCKINIPKCLYRVFGAGSQAAFVAGLLLRHRLLQGGPQPRHPRIARQRRPCTQRDSAAFSTLPSLLPVVQSAHGSGATLQR